MDPIVRQRIMARKVDMAAYRRSWQPDMNMIRDYATARHNLTRHIGAPVRAPFRPDPRLGLPRRMDRDIPIDLSWLTGPTPDGLVAKPFDPMTDYFRASFRWQVKHAVPGSFHQKWLQRRWDNWEAQGHPPGFLLPKNRRL